MSAPSKFDNLVPELFPVISAHLPLFARAPTLLSLALTCHRLYDIINPDILYNSVRLIGKDQTLDTLKSLITATRAVGGDTQKPSPSHCIRYLCIDSVRLHERNTCLEELQQLVDIAGLSNLVSLTIRLKNSPYGLDIPPSTFSKIWNSLKTNCPSLREIHITGLAQDYEDQWKSELFTIQGLTSIRLEGDLDFEEHVKFVRSDLSSLPSSLHTLELRIYPQMWYRETDISPGAEGLLSCVFPNLRCLIIDYFDVGDPSMTNRFWKAHSGLERLELLVNVTGKWFQDFEDGMLPDLKVLKSKFSSARILLPHIAKSLVSLCLHNTYNAQAPYLLRTITQAGTLPALRSLSIHLRETENRRKPYEGGDWREDDNGVVKQVEMGNTERKFDGNYLMSVAKAASKLEELELMGESDDTIDAIAASLSRMPNLHRLTLSGPTHPLNSPFFKTSRNWPDWTDWVIDKVPEEEHGKYGPMSFEQVAQDLANGCRTLDTVTIGEKVGDLVVRNGLSANIIRDTKSGLVKEVQRTTRAWGNTIGREEEW